MEIRWGLYLYVVANCAYCVAKPVSLNEVIAAASQQKQIVHAASPKLKEPVAEHFSLNKGLKPLLRAPKKFEETGSIFPLGKKISSLKYRKTFQIKSPLRPNRIKYSLRRHKRKNQSLKREIGGNEKLNQKYIPLLRSLGMLVDNLLGAESSESAELTSKRKRVRYYTDTSEILCPCSKSNAGLESEEAADTSAETVSDEASPTQVTPQTPHTLAASNFRNFRQNQIIPILLPRNTLSGRRDDNRLGTRSRAAHHGRVEGNITRDHGDCELGTGDGSHESNAADDEEDTSGDSRYGSSRAKPRGRVRDRHTNETRNHTEARNGEGQAIDETNAKAHESALERPRGNFDKPKRKNKQPTGNIEKESAEFLSTPVGRLRGFPPAGKVDIPESKFESKEHVAQDYSGDQRLADGSSALTEKNKETSTKHATVELNNIPTIRPLISKTEGPVVVIIDGYSVTRNKNGENKLQEKEIRINSK